MRQLLFILCAWSAPLFAQTNGDCAGTPPDAVTRLPEPLEKWAQVACTPYGHVISARAGWLWTNPGSYSPVFIPAQMVRENPAELGNNAYFTQVAATPVKDEEFEEAYAAFTAGLDKDRKVPLGYRVEVKSVSGKSLKLYFFDYGDSAWGIWCNKSCDTQSRFMILNMANRPSP